MSENELNELFPLVVTLVRTHASLSCRQCLVDIFNLLDVLSIGGYIRTLKWVRTSILLGHSCQYLFCRLFLLWCESPERFTMLPASSLCELGPCFNGGTCEFNSGERRGYICQCPQEYEGRYCQLRIQSK